MSIDPLHLAFGDMEYEFGVTREMLSRIPDDCFDWRPHKKSWTMGQLACHIVDLLWWSVTILEEDGIDMAKTWPRTEASTQEELIAKYEAKEKQLREVFDRTTVETLAEPWTLSYGPQIFFTEPKADVLRRFGISHLVHHRAQLSVYLRINDVPLPKSYGPTADEN
ncbi:MAG: DinB family protein [Bacteroidetes bacterium]|nr:DinB family protein [Bacteroidota bacterium]